MSPSASPVARIRAVLSVGVVLALSAVMFTSSARLAREEGRSPQDFPQLVAHQLDHVASLQEQVGAVSAEIKALSGTALPGNAPTADARGAMAAGTVAVSGPGLTVTLNDAPPDEHYPDGVHPDDLVVHQQDIEAVVNALWAGGAEAMTLQGERVTATSAFRCAGNILLLHGRVFSPPYAVSAIGDPKRLTAALNRSPQVTRYKEWVDAVNLGWDVKKSSDLLIGPYEGLVQLKYARADAEGD